MSNIEYFGIPYQDDAELKNYRLVQRKKARRLTERYNKNREAIALIDEYAELQQQEAFAAYQKMRAEQKCNDDRAAGLFCLNIRR